MVFVTTLSNRGEHDPWAHRKGEPRLFALLWSGFLMAAAILTIFATRGGGVASARQHEFGALSFMSIAAFGAVALWPMVRLSQASPDKPRRALIADLLVVLLPLHVIVWPTPLLTRWPIEVPSSILLVVSGWTLIAGAVVLFATSGPGTLPVPSDTGAEARARALRAWASAALVLGIVAGPLIDVGSHAFSLTGLGPEAYLLSPLTAGWAVAQTPAENLAPRIEAGEWLILSLPGIVGLAALLVGMVICRPAKHR
jgi:hypothetical protein